MDGSEEATGPATLFVLRLVELRLRQRLRALLVDPSYLLLITYFAL